MVSYQTFPDQPGDSNSFAKLASFPMPCLTGKSFLDIGCNEGFFCGFAVFEGARSIVGVDNNEYFIKKARERFPQCQFVQKDWLAYLSETDKKFDVILCASALHYAPDQGALVDAMVARLARDGVLLLEIGIAPETSPDIIAGEREGWVKCKRDIDERLFATWQGVKDMLEPYAWKYLGESVMQKGDSVPRHVFHVQKAKPCAILLCGDSASGKSTTARKIFGSLPSINGDLIWSTVLNMEDKYPKLAALAKTRVNWGMINQLAEKMFLDGSWEDYADLVANMGNEKDFVFDGYIPAHWLDKFTTRLEKYGYRVLRMEMPSVTEPPAEMLSRTRMETRKYNMFLEAYSRKTLRRQ